MVSPLITNYHPWIRLILHCIMLPQNHHRLPTLQFSNGSRTLEMRCRLLESLLRTRNGYYPLQAWLQMISVILSLNGIENVTCGSHPGVSDMSEERSRCLLDIFRLLMCRHLHDTSIQPLSLHSIFYVIFSCPLTLEVLIDSFHNPNDNINIMKR